MTLIFNAKANVVSRTRFEPARQVACACSVGKGCLFVQPHGPLLCMVSSCILMQGAENDPDLQREGERSEPHTLRAGEASSLRLFCGERLPFCPTARTTFMYGLILHIDAGCRE